MVLILIHLGAYPAYAAPPPYSSTAYSPYQQQPHHHAYHHANPNQYQPPNTATNSSPNQFQASFGARFGNPAAVFGGFSGGGAMNGLHHPQLNNNMQQQQSSSATMRNSASGPAETKSDQPMVTIKRVMRPDTSEPTVTISVKREEKDAEKVREDKPKKK